MLILLREKKMVCNFLTVSICNFLTVSIHTCHVGWWECGGTGEWWGDGLRWYILLSTYEEEEVS